MRYLKTHTVDDARNDILSVDKIFNIIINKLEKDGELEPEYIRKHFGDVLKKIENGAHIIYLQSETEAIDKLVDNIAESIPPYATRRETIKQTAMSAIEFEYRTGQSRKSRGGSTFQKAVDYLLNRIDIAHERPRGQDAKDYDEIDFIVPSVQYARRMPEQAILLSIKRTARERWKQVVSERTLTHVYLILHDAGDLSPDRVESVKKNKIILYVYEEIKNSDKFRNEDFVRSLNDLPAHLERYSKPPSTRII